MGRDAPLARQALLLLLPLGLAGLVAAPASAQSQGLVVRDGSLGGGPLEVGPDVDPLGRSATYLIAPEMGEQSDRNLFHSFKFFGIGWGETATFTGPDPIDGPQSVSNVIGRVTGGTRSEIDGTLRSTIPGADVWLFNPQGVGIGAGAVIDVPGSFHAGSADSVEFEDGGEPFRARAEPEPLLATAKPSAFGFLPDGERAALVVEGGLAVTRGEALLAGGDVLLSGAVLSAPGGHLGLEASGQVTLTEAIVGGKLVPSLVDVGGLAPGTVSIRGGQIEIKQGSQVLAENAGAGPGGRIEVAANESLTIDAGLLSVSTSSAGDAGRIELRGGDLRFRNGPGVSTGFSGNRFDPTKLPRALSVGAAAETLASGAAGAIEIDAQSVEVTDGAGLSAATVGAVGADGQREEASGAGGRLDIQAESVRIADRGFLKVDSWGSRGDAGAIDITADSLTLDARGAFTAITATSLTTAGWYPLDAANGPPNLGRPGTITIKAGFVGLRDGLSSGGVHISSQCLNCVGSRSGETVLRIEAKEMEIDGGRIRTTVHFGGSGDAGDIEVRAGKLEILRGGISSGTTDEGTSGGTSGDAGDVVIHAGELALRGGFIASTTTTGSSGDAGDVEIHAGSLVLAGGGVDVGTRTSGNAGTISILDAGSLVIGNGSINASAFQGSSGNAGTINILDAGSLAIGPGGSVLAQTEGAGKAGAITVRADSVRVEGESALISASSFGAASPNAVVGNAGDIVVEADSIVLTNQGGEPHTLTEALFDRLFTGIFSATVRGGNGGSIRLVAPDITIESGAGVATSTVSGGKGGTIDLLGDRILVANGGWVDSTSQLDPRLSDPSTARDSGDAGNVTLVATESIEVRGDDPVFGVGRVSSFSLGSGAAGAVTLQAPRIVVDAGAVATTALPSEIRLPSGSQREGTGGGVLTLAAGKELLVRNGGRVDASTFIAGAGGSIVATAGVSIRVEGEGSGIASRTGGTGVGGSVALGAPQIHVRGGGEVSAESAPGFGALAELFDPTGPLEGLIGTVIQESKDVRGNAGSVTLAATKLVHLDDGDITTSVGVAQGGEIEIDPVFVILQHGSSITSKARNEEGQGGHIRITTDNFFQFPGNVVSAQGRTPELSGTVEIHSPDVNLAGTLAELPSSFLDAAALMRERCAARRSGERAGSFAVRGPGGIPAEPDGWLRAPVVLPDTAATAAATAAQPVLFASLPGPLLAHGACP